MFARANSQHHQVAYVTNDLEGAMALFKRVYGAPGFMVGDNEMTNRGRPDDVHIRLALCNVGGVEIELIEPIGDSAPLYSNWLAGGSGLQIKFHHVCIRIDGPIENWKAHLASLDPATHPVVFEGSFGDDCHFKYTDETPRLGHYIEHVWFSPKLAAQLREAIPRFAS
jgi:Glyoxalase/Bleomycin resistance protein/Dioxygenase superfamily